MSQSLKTLQERIGYVFRRKDLLQRALTHRSFAGEGGSETDNERLEFLGDAVLDLAVSEALMERFPDYSEGRLSKIRALLVGADNLSDEARRLALGESLLLGKAEENSGGREKRNTLANALEALVAAVYLDGGLQRVQEVISRVIASPDQIDHADASIDERNPKSTLQELLHARGLPVPRYRVIDESGPPHDRTFTVSVKVGDLCRATGTGASKRAAEQEAAARALVDPRLKDSE